MKKFTLIFLILCLLPLSVFGQYDNFFRVDSVLLVVNDVTSLVVGAEDKPYQLLLSSGVKVFLTDTTGLDDVTHDGVNNWNTYNLVIICSGTDGRTLDVSSAGGLKDVNIICFEPDYWSDIGLPDSSGWTIVEDDTLHKIQDNTDFIVSPYEIDESWASQGSVGSDTVFNFIGGSLLSVNVLVTNLSETDTIVVVDTVANFIRVGSGVSSEMNSWSIVSTTTMNMWDIFFRAVASCDDTTGLTFYDFVAVDENSDARDRRQGPENYVNYLEAIGHNVLWTVFDSLVTDNATFDGTNRWDAMDAAIIIEAIGVADSASLASTDSLIAADISMIFIPPEGVVDYSAYKLGIASGVTFDYGSDEDSLSIISTTSTITNGIFSGSFDLFVSGQDGYEQYVSDSFQNSNFINLADSETNDTLSIWAHHINKRRVWLGVSPAFGTVGELSDSIWVAAKRSFGWLFLSSPLQPSGVTLTALNTDSMAVSWTDNADNEDGYAVFVHNPDSVYYSSLGAGIIGDTIFYIWPPNAKVTVDVAVILGTDTLFSVEGKQTAYTDAVTPEAPRIWNKSDTEQYYSIGGYEFEDIFSDSNYTANPTWVSIAGTWDVDNPDNWLEAVASNDTMSIAYDHNVDLFRDAYISFEFQMADSTYLSSQTARFYINSNTSDFTGTGYFVEIDSTALTLEKFTGASETVLITYAWERDFDWHTILLQYDWDESPQDTTVEWTMSYDGTSTGTSADETYLPTTGTHIGMTASNAGIHFDNFWIYGVTPGANAVNTPFALNESNSGKFVDYDTGTLESGTTWGYYSDFGNFSGGTLTGLTKATSYVFRLKAKSGRTK